MKTVDLKDYPPRCHLGVREFMEAAAKQATKSMMQMYPEWARLKDGYKLAFTCRCGERIEVPYVDD